MMNRKTIKKLKLVQWSCFLNETVQMDGSTLFTGVNGSGKSTILDAISYLFTANTQFNSAAKDRDRTVKGYVRGDTKSNGKDQFLRTGEVVSYIAAELESETDGSSFVIGVCIESPNSTDSCSSNWFILKDTVLDDVRMSEEVGRNLTVFPKRQLCVKGKYLKGSDFMSRDHAKRQILRALGLRCEPDKYKNKLIKMMAFNPENNVDQFIQNCVLEPGKVDSLKELRSQKERFEELKGVYENLKISKGKLEIVEKYTYEYESVFRSFQNRSLMLCYQDMIWSKEEKDNIERRIKTLTNKKNSLENELFETEKKMAKARERYDTARNNKDFSDIQSSLDAINRQLSELEMNLRDVSADISRLKSLKDSILQLRNSLGTDWTLAVDESVLGGIGECSVEAEKGEECVEKCIEHVDEIHRLLQKRQYENEAGLSKEENKWNVICSALRELENKRVPYPEDVTEAKQILIRELEKKYKSVEVRFFAELVSEVKNPSYRKAVETFLGKKRFYLIVDDAYVEDAMHILNEKKIYSTNVVIADKIPDSDIIKGSAAEILEIPNNQARRYANYLLNGIHLCESIEELHQYPKGGLTKDGMLAKSYSAAIMDMRNTKCFLGNDVIEMQIKAYQKEKNESERIIKELKECINSFEEKMNCIKKADLRIKDYSFQAPFKFREIRNEHETILAQKQKLESEPGFVQIVEEINRAKKIVDELEEKERKLRDDRSKQELRIQLEKENEKKNAAEVFTKTTIYEEARIKYSGMEKQMLEDYEKMRKKNPEDARVIKQKSVEHLRTDMDRARINMENAQLDYLKAAGMNLEKRGVSFIPFFNEEKRLISNVKIEEASNKLESHAKEMESTFMTDFVSEMNESILAAKREVETINNELKRLPFGNDTYMFMMEERGDRSDFFRICGKLNDYTSVEMLQSVNADDEELKNDIRNFMDKILSEPDESEFTDYRKYFKYDMRIRTKKGNQEIEADLSKKQGSASNGEKQTPYFIILAASLIQCYPKDSECARLALIDEAFAALSRERIEQMVKYLEDNHFQVIYAAPPEKISSIGDLIGTTVSLVSTGRYTKMVEGLVKI